MLFLFECPTCRARIEADASVSGRQAHCPQCRGVVAVPESRVDCGATLGSFRLDSRLGKGGMGEVFLGTQISVDRRVAVKVLPQSFAADRTAVERFLHEGRLAARLDHGNIVTVHEAGEDCGHYYMAMAYVEGESLDQRLKRDGALPEREALTIIRTVAEALCYAWDEFRLLHRDLKPANIMLDRRGRVFLMDLGLAKSLGEETGMTMSGTILGTPHYMSPEQAMGSSQLSVQTDIYALGATLYHLVVGAPPFTGDSALKVLSQHVHEALTPPRARNPQVSEACSALIGVMMAKAPRDRYAGWRELTAAIDRVLSGAAAAVPPAPASAGGAAHAVRTAELARQAQAALARQHQVAGPPPVVAVRKSAAAGGTPAPATPWGRLRRRPWAASIAAGAAVVLVLSGTLALRSRGVAAVPPALVAQAGRGAAGEAEQGSQASQASQAGQRAKAGPARQAVQAAAAVAGAPPAAAASGGAVVRAGLRVPAGFRAAPGAEAEPYTGTGWAREVVHEATGIAMVYIPAGSFTMGSPPDEAERRDDERQHPVTLTRGFYMGKHEVTQGQWEAVMGSNPSHFTTAGRDAPVEQVSWGDCQGFCQKLREGFRLPTEAEWEYAARGGPASGGFVYSGSNNVGEVAWYDRNSGQHTHQVGKKRANELGLYDMSGNVWEWCQDWYGKYPAGAVTDPAGPGAGSIRLYRGGCWGNLPDRCRSGYRDRFPPSYRFKNLGCRLVRTVP